MTFTTLFIAHVPDADPERDACLLGTQMYKLHVRLVTGQAQALEVCRTLVKAEGNPVDHPVPGPFRTGNISEIDVPLPLTFARTGA